MALKPWSFPQPDDEGRARRAAVVARQRQTLKDGGVRLTSRRVAEHTPAVRPSQAHLPPRSCPYCGRPLRGAAVTCRAHNDLPGLEPLNEWA